MRQEKVTYSGTAYYICDGQNVLIETNASLVSQVKYTDLPGMCIALGDCGGVSTAIVMIVAKLYVGNT